MLPFGFAAPREIRFGRGVAAEAAPRIAAMGRRLALVHGASGARADWLASGLMAQGVLALRIACGAEPDLPALEAALAQARAAGVDAVAALGGGAAIDMGKALAALIPSVTPPLTHLEVVGEGRPLGVDPLPFAALPTTAGTGAEVTKNAVIGVPEARRKVSLRDARMIPDVVLIDPALADGTPRAVTLASGLDAITQVIEPFLSSRANPLTDALCRAAIPRGLAALARLMQGEDADARDDMAVVALTGGLALANAGLGAVHGLAGPIGGLAPAAPHGAVCGALLPAVMLANAAALYPGHPAVARMQEAEGMVSEALCVEGWAGLADWSRRAGLPGLSAMGVTPADYPALAAAALGSSSMRGNPVPLSQAVLERVLAESA
ncbi:iron-containing alcohol dehydrogenase [Rhodovulum bhavnagarense]|uniref:iron-containing alcohol dehydrogenase n=1 Tax=Rhodovulum bhavnagarense TaxID=992286 RepID=UPI00104D480E|nr:iron-containing alcohol dehydrogenase [Rhodovulum bhavnagarense]